MQSRNSTELARKSIPQSNFNAGRKERRPHQVFSRALRQTWRYGIAAGDTRKKYLVRRRLAHLSHVLSQFDPKGNCQNIYAAMDSKRGILAKLLEFEATRPKGERLKWSRPTVYRYMGLLRRAGIEAVSPTPYMGRARRRLLDCRALLQEPPRAAERESETSPPTNLR